MTSKQITLSVVIPAYNDESRIARALASVLNQDHRADEIIVVDDGSVDRTGEVVRSLGQRVVYVHQRNQGSAAARNTGIMNARCEFIAFLDADDEWFPGHLEEAVRVLNGAPNVQWFCAAFERRAQDGATEFVSAVDGRLVRNSVITDYFEAEARHCFSRSSTMIIRRRLFDETGLFDIDMQVGEDLDMWFRIALHYPEIGYSSRPGCIYWRRAGSLTDHDKIDIPRFLRRINRTEQAAIKLGAFAVRRSNKLTVRWLTQTVRYGVKQNDFAVLKRISSQYGARLPLGWRFAGKIFANSTFCMLGAWLLALKRKRGTVTTFLH